MNKLHEFSSGAFSTFETVESVVEDVLGSLGCLGRGSWIVDATVENAEDSVVHGLLEKHGMHFADARGISTGVNECIERAGMNHETIACVIAANSSAASPPLMILAKDAREPDEYIKIYSANDVDVFARQDIARRIGVRTMEIVGKKNALANE